MRAGEFGAGEGVCKGYVERERQREQRVDYAPYVGGVAGGLGGLGWLLHSAKHLREAGR